MSSGTKIDAPKHRLRGLDDLRRHPDRLVTASELIDLGVAESEDDLKKLPPQLRLPGAHNMFQRGWEARTVLLYIGAGLYLPPVTRRRRKVSQTRSAINCPEAK